MYTTLFLYTRVFLYKMPGMTIYFDDESYEVVKSMKSGERSKYFQKAAKEYCLSEDSTELLKRKRLKLINERIEIDSQISYVEETIKQKEEEEIRSKQEEIETEKEKRSREEKEKAKEFNEQVDKYAIFSLKNFDISKNEAREVSREFLNLKPRPAWKPWMREKGFSDLEEETQTEGKSIKVSKEEFDQEKFSALKFYKQKADYLAVLRENDGISENQFWNVLEKVLRPLKESFENGEISSEEFRSKLSSAMGGLEDE